MFVAAYCDLHYSVLYYSRYSNLIMIINCIQLYYTSTSQTQNLTAIVYLRKLLMELCFNFLGGASMLSCDRPSHLLTADGLRPAGLAMDCGTVTG